MSEVRQHRLRKRVYRDVPRQRLGPLECHWTEDEMVAAAEEAERITRAEFAREAARSEERDPGPEDRKRAWLRATAAANKRHLELGVAGVPPFARLPYFRCGHSPLKPPDLPCMAVSKTISRGQCMPMP